MRKVVRLTESDLVRLVKRVIIEKDGDRFYNNFEINMNDIEIPDKYDALQSEIGGDVTDSFKIMKLYNEIISDGIYDDIPDDYPSLISFDGDVFENSNEEKMTVDEVLGELNNALS